MRLRHVRYRPEDLQVHSAVPSRSRVHLQAGVSGFWNDAFKIMSAIPALGVIVIRIIEVFTVSQSIVLTVCFVVMLGGISLATMNWLSRSKPAISCPHRWCASRYMNEDVVHSLYT
ncbi:hypothetical protein SCLCIDRAFT_1209817 [Scleroderma citrinum Foug A]|uniref:Uncharacterized protein n=1 Tax=Scleroderma citrinum Foug A TaxID=1036808 RepID=A0A0C3EHG9_9AGAM|nr:hypothetical protein SCLCIDRAFT_1209817 [Scleroderma citrinum Foug A]